MTLQNGSGQSTLGKVWTALARAGEAGAGLSGIACAAGVSQIVAAETITFYIEHDEVEMLMDVSRWKYRIKNVR